jgi:hypothetical protein
MKQILFPPFPRLNDSVGQALTEKVEPKGQAHSLPDCVTQAGMRNISLF